MPGNLLLFLPLLAGYAFIHICYLTRYRAQSLSGHALIFETAAAGLVSVPFGHLLLQILRCLPYVEALRSWWHGQPLAVPFAAAVVAGLLVAILAALVCNLALGLWHCREGSPALTENSLEKPEKKRLPERFSQLLDLSRDAALARATQSSGNDLWMILRKAALEQQLVFLSLGNRKVYVGYVTRAPSLKPTGTHVSVLPLLSGHRDAGTLAVTYDIFYKLEKYQDQEVAVALPASEIREARFYYFDLEYDRLSLEAGTQVPGER
jgi:hypothetical protein